MHNSDLTRLNVIDYVVLAKSEDCKEKTRFLMEDIL